jgi:hypothetical protein
MSPTSPNDTSPDTRSSFRVRQSNALAFWIAKGAPVLPATRCGDELVIMCPACKVEHRHGALSGHRIAHCRDPFSPLRDTGYIIVEMRVVAS